MTDLGFADRWLTRLDAAEEIAHMVVADIQPLGSRWEWCDEQFWIARFEDASRNPDPAVGANEFHSVLLPLGIDN